MKELLKTLFNPPHKKPFLIYFVTIFAIGYIFDSPISWLLMAIATFSYWGFVIAKAIEANNRLDNRLTNKVDVLIVDVERQIEKSKEFTNG